MKTSILLISFLAFFIFTETVSPVAATIDTLCSYLEGFYVPRDYCTATFLRDPRSSRTTNNTEFAVISIDIVASATAELRSEIAKLSGKETDRAVKQRLDSCSEKLGAASAFLSRARVAAAAKDYDGAIDLIEKYESGPQACLDEFSATEVMHESSDLLTLGHLASSTSQFVGRG